MMAKCCFQIWQKQPAPRIIVDLPISHPDWIFLSYGPLGQDGQPTPPKDADFAIRAYGGRCGDIQSTNLQTLRPKSWHWIQSNINKNTLIDRFMSLDYSISEDTARQNSLGRSDLILLYLGNFDLLGESPIP
jgi:hypothetical protein